MLIPKIIHQIAPSDKSSWHPIWEKCHQSWRTQFPDFEHKLWNDEDDIDNFVKENYLQYYDLYSSFPYKIMKINFARYCLLDFYGGIYADMDVYCYKNFYNIIKNKDLWFNENKFGEFCDPKIYKIENCLIASSIKNSFWKDVFDKCKERFFTLQPLFVKKTIAKEWLIIHLTDSDLFEQSKNFYNPKQINFFPADLFNNLTDYYSEELFTKHLRTEKWKEDL